ncbi:MAG: DUF481 domain-containing protein [Burkholderiales bacterium]|nr:DUF481 domain-containing protein [Burkholderiales bacterium]
MITRTLLLCWVGAAHLAAHAEAATPVQAWTGDLALGLQLSDSESKTRRYTASADLSRRHQRSELSLEFDLDREYVKIPGNQAELDRDRYDLRLKYRHDLQDQALFGYVSPRWRRNASGYYVQAKALRAGFGGRFRPVEPLLLTLEAGAGYRVARVEGGATAREGLGTIAAQARWKLRPGVEWRLEFAHEQSRGERYRTLESSLHTRISEHLGVKVRASYERGYPFSSTDPSAETNLDVSLSYAL